MKSTRKTKTTNFGHLEDHQEVRPGDPTIEYFAGFFDGEGSVSYGSSPLLRVNNTDLGILLAFYRRWGGTLCRVDSNVKNHRTLYTWRVSGEAAMKMAEDLIPHLREKWAQVDLLFTMRPLPPWQRTPLRKVLSHLKHIDSDEREKKLL